MEKLVAEVKEDSAAFFAADTASVLGRRRQRSTWLQLAAGSQWCGCCLGQPDRRQRLRCGLVPHPVS